MADLSPDLGAKLGRLLPRLASDHPGEVVATVAALRRTLGRAGLDLHDLAARLAEPPQPAQHAQHEAPGGDLRAMAEALRADALGRLTRRQGDFIRTACRLLAAGRTLTPRQAEWLRGLYAMHGEE